MSNRKSNQRKNKRRKSNQSYDVLEPKQLLATLTVTTSDDIADGSLDGEVSLREAVIAANTNQAFGDAPAGDAAGDLIVFDASLLDETIELSGNSMLITEALTINGTDVSITIDAQYDSRVFAVDTDQPVVLRGFTIVGGNEVEGGAVYVKGGGTLRLIDLAFHRNGLNQIGGSVTEQGGAVYNLNSSVFTVDSVFSGNKAFEGGAIYSVDGEMRFSNTRLSGNNATFSGGAVTLVDGDYFFGDTQFVDNVAVDDMEFYGPGGAIYSGVSANVFINDGLFERNQGSSGGAIYNTNESVMDIRNGTRFFNNDAVGTGGTDVPADGEGGAIYNRSEMRLVDVSMEANSAAFGGGLFSNNGNTIVRALEATANSAYHSGGAIAVRGGLTRIYDSQIGGQDLSEGNRAAGDLAQGLRGYGGGIAALESAGFDDQTVVRIVGGAIENNSAFIFGGGIANLGDATVQVLGGTTIDGNHANAPTTRDIEGKGGGIYSSGTMLVSVGTQISNNRSTHFGGGVFVAEGKFNMDRVVITANQANVRGGGIEIGGGDVRLFSTTIGGDSLAEGNVAGSYGTFGLPGRGGGIYMSGDEGTRLRMIKGQVSFNTATVAGGGMWNNSGNVIRLENGVSVNNNRAMREDGGAAYNHGGHFEVRDAVFENNTARNGAGLFNNVGTARFINTTIESNTARVLGGGIYSRAFFQLNNSSVTNNVASSLSFSDVFEELV